jgi:hypothetical protein
VRAALALLVPIAAAVATTALLHQLVLLPDDDMVASRVVPALALARGLPIYAGPTGGPIIDFMYGPVAALAFLPAALASTPTGAILVAALVNLLVFFGPIAWLHLRRGGGRVALAALACFVLVVLRDVGLEFSGCTVHADAPALGLAALAIGLLVPVERQAPTRLGASALVAVLSVWTKQTMVLLLPALLLFVLVRDGLREATAYLLRLAFWGSVVTAAIVAVFGLRDLWFNMVVLPGRMPWYGDHTPGTPALGPTGGARLSARLLAQNAWPLALVVVVVAAARLRQTGRAALAEPWALLALVGVALVPMAIVGGAKVGGYLNTHSVTSYFLAAAATLGLATLARASDGSGLRLLVATLTLLTVERLVAPDGPRALAATIGGLRRFADNAQERAFRAAREEPGAIYFPWNPLATLLAEERLDNNEIGAWNRELAEIPIEDAQWRAHLPPRLRLLAYRPPAGAFTWLPAPPKRLPEFTEPATIPLLPGWIVRAQRPLLAAPRARGREADAPRS